MKKFTWIFGLALLWGGLNAVAQTKEVGTFADLEKAVKNIPVFGKVAQKETAYNTAVSEYNAANKALGEAQTKYDEAVTAKENADGEVTKAETAASPFQEAYDEALKEQNNAQTTLDNFPDDQKIDKKLTGYSYNQYKSRYNEYEVFYQAINEPNISITPKMYCGIYPKTSPYNTDKIIFALGDDMRDAVDKKLGENKVKWYPNAITPNTLYPEGDDFDRSLTSFTLKISETESKTYNPKEANLYYFDYYPNDSRNDNDFQENCTALRNGVYKFTTSDYYVDEDGVQYFDVILAFQAAWYYTERVYPSTPIYKESPSEAYKQAEAALKTAKERLTDAEENLKEPAAALKAATEALAKAEEALATASTGLSTAETAKKDALSTLKNAVSELNDVATDIAVKDGEGELQYETVLEYVDENGETQKIEVLKYEKPYTQINISQPIILTEKDLESTTKAYFWENWDEGYTLNGNGYYIQSSKPLFATNKGTIENLANLDGSIARKNSGDVYYCLTRISHGYRVYDGEGNPAEYKATGDDDDMPLSDVMYKIRNAGLPFGYDAETNTFKRAMNTTEKSRYKLYKAQYANAVNRNVYPYYFNIDNTETGIEKIKYNTTTFSQNIPSGLTTENAILYIENSDADALIGNIENVAVKSGSIYNCQKMTMKEGADVEEFYIPYSVTSNELAYNRKFTSDIAAVCLPFELTENLQKELEIKAYQFKRIDENTGTMWFRIWDKVPANKPCLIAYSEKDGGRAIFDEYKKSLIVEATAGETLTTEIGDWKFCGTYAYSYPSRLIGNQDILFYGINKGELVKSDPNLPEENQVRLRQFRSYVYNPNISVADAPSLKIGLLDEDDNEITAIETVSGEIVSGFKAKGGDNAIEIITDKACQVKVYALNGALVKSTRVEAGVTSLPVKAGMYVVNGVKVIVK
ncbi:MAG: hypothetical protein K2O17_03820 [Bacteroidaceae bacterium]|nr:hypothetical protein [Bacteroidaceae bacterium]